MVKLAAIVVLAGTFLFSSGCCWPMWEGRHHRYGDPYGDGWLAEIEPNDMADLQLLASAETYAPQMQARAELERQK